MPKTKKASYNKRNKNIKQRMQSLRFQNSDTSTSPAQSEHVHKHGNISTMGEDVELVTATKESDWIRKC